MMYNLVYPDCGKCNRLMDHQKGIWSSNLQLCWTYTSDVILASIKGLVKSNQIDYWHNWNTVLLGYAKNINEIYSKLITWIMNRYVYNYAKKY